LAATPAHPAALPVLAMSRDTAGIAGSKRNLMQLHIAHQMYASDHNGNQWVNAPHNLAAYGDVLHRDGKVQLANSDPRLLFFFCEWLRRFFEIDESRLRVWLYLHEGLDLDEANAFLALITGIPLSQFRKPYRAVPDAGIRTTKHIYGCPSVVYSCSKTHRAIMGLVHGLFAPEAIGSPGLPVVWSMPTQGS
jgi:hypothetical protein